MVIPFLSPVTVQLKVKVSPEQVGGGAVNCPVTTAGGKILNEQYFHYVLNQTVSTCNSFNVVLVYLCKSVWIV